MISGGKSAEKKETYLKELAFSRRVEKALLAKENFLSQTPSAVTLFCSDELFFFLSSNSSNDSLFYHGIGNEFVLRDFLPFSHPHGFLN